MGELNYISIDFETANYYKNSACSVGLVRFVDGIEADSCYSLIRPAKMYFIPEWTRDIHGISYNDVRNKPLFNEVWTTIVMPFVNQTPDYPFVAHNGDFFDMPVIKECCACYNIPHPKNTFFDSLKVAKKTWPNFSSHKLTYLGEKFGISYKAHDALEDSRTCGKIIKIAADEWNATSVEELLSLCQVPMKKF